MAADLIDLRAVLRRVPSWEDLAWDGTNVFAIFRNRVAPPSTHKALARVLEGIVPITASRQRRSMVISTCTREDAVREIAAGHLVAANIAIDELLQSQPLGTLVKLASDPHVMGQVQQRVRAVIHSKTVCAVDVAESISESSVE